MDIVASIYKKHQIERYFYLVIGLIICACTYNIFIVPNDIVFGGVGGISIIANHFLGVKPSIFMLGCSFVLCLVGFVFLPREKVLRLNYCYQLEKLPKKSICIIADDIAASGFSMGEALGYSKIGDELSTDKHILFCPISATNSAIDYIRTMIFNMNRNGIDDVLYVKDSIKSHDLIAEKFIGKQDTQFYKNVFGYDEEEFSSYGMCTAFPYMAPDNNSVLSGFLLKHFTLNKKCIKSKSVCISDIEKDTYYYDIFGTSEKNVLTRLDFRKSFKDKVKDLIYDIFKKNKQ